MKSIKAKMILIIAVLVVFITASIGALSNGNARNAVTDEVQNAIRLVANEGADLVASRVETQTTFLEAIARHRAFISYAKTGMALSNTDMQYLEDETERMGYQALGVSNIKGEALRNDGITVSIADREFFTVAKEGKSTVSDVLIDKVTGNPIIIYSVPILDNDKVTGVLYGVRDVRELSDIVKDITVGESGYAYMINDEGVTIAHRDFIAGTDENIAESAKEDAGIDATGSASIRYENTTEDAKKDKDLVQLAELEGRMRKGEAGVGQYSYQGKDKILGFAPVPGTDWSLAVTAELSEALSGVDKMRNEILVISVIYLAIGIACAFALSRIFANPIVSMTSLLERFADYDLTFDEHSSAVKYLKRKDEIGRITNAVAKMQKAFADLLKQAVASSETVGATAQELSASIQEISSTAQNQASNTEEVSSSVEEMTANIGTVNNDMQRATMNVSAMSQTIVEMGKATGINAKDLKDIDGSLGSILSALENTRQSIHTISDRSESASREARATVEMAGVGKENLDKTVTQMAGIQETILSLSKVINGLGESAGRIGDITDLIKDVAEQTNLLALNASIEAARAGEHGKGFAVVAQAIGNLAEESQNATKEITQVIKNIQAEIGKAVQNSEEGTRVVESGTLLVKDTSSSLEKIFQAIQMTSDVINDITARMDTQSRDINGVYDSANDIGVKVNDLMAAMKQETKDAADVSEKLRSIDQMVNEISDSMEQQSAASEQVSSAINDNAAGIEEISSGSEEISRSAEELAKSAQELVEHVQKFKI